MPKSENGAAAQSEKKSGKDNQDPEKRLTPVEEIEAAYAAQTVTMCCCCVCQCEDKATLRRKCCIIFPLKCGIQFVALAVVIIAVCQFLEVFYQLLNDQIDWWYVLVGALLCIPLIIAFAFAVVFFASESDGSRVLLRAGLILTIVGLTLSAAWNATYFWWFYKSNEVNTGNDGVGFVRNTRKQEIVFSIYIAAVLDAFFAYFICITQEYIECYREEDILTWIKQNIKNKDEEAQPFVQQEADNGQQAAAPPSDPVPEEEPNQNAENNEDPNAANNGGEPPAEDPAPGAGDAA